MFNILLLSIILNWQKFRSDLGASDVTGGALVAARASETAAEYGLQPSDVVVAVNLTAVRGLDDLRQHIARLPPRAPCVLRVLRQGQFMYLAFELE